MEPWSRKLAGRLDEHELESDALRGNHLGDPHRRPLWVYVPPGAGDAPLPSIYLIQGHTGQLDMWRNRSAFRPTVPELVDRLFAEEGCPDAFVVFVDAWTSYGGSQFLDSPAVGNYHTYLCEEVVPFVDARYPTQAEATHRGITGKSSGGYGAMVTPMLRPDLFGGLATHAGDALFENCYLPDFREVARSLRDDYDGSFDRFWEDFRSRPAFAKETDFPLLNTWAMAACYSAAEDGSVDLPFEPHTGQLREEVWQRWLAWDPVRMVDAHADTLRALRAIYIDSGKRVVVTGGTSGIGEATSRRFLAEGARVVALALGEEEVATAAERIAGLADAIRCDVADRSAVDAAFERVDELLGGVDVLVANAGISIRRPFLEIAEADWRRVLDVNLTGVFHCAQEAARRMDEGVILMTASTNGLTGHEYYADYNASKAGVILLARTMARELAPKVRVNAVCPGYVLTPMQEAEYTVEMIAAVNAAIPLGRHALPGEIAALYAFLASDEGAYFTGAVITVDGGEIA